MFANVQLRFYIPSSTMTSPYLLHQITTKYTYNARQKELPFKKPKNKAEVHAVLVQMTIYSCRGKPFLLVSDEVDHVVIFFCETNLQVLGQMEILFVDGTFEYCEKFFTQLFTIYGIKNGNYVQLCYALLPSECTVTYTHFLNVLTDVCPLVASSTVVVDFESEISRVWSGTKIVGCEFHLNAGARVADELQ